MAEEEERSILNSWLIFIPASGPGWECGKGLDLVLTSWKSQDCRTRCWEATRKPGVDQGPLGGRK